MYQPIEAQAAAFDNLRDALATRNTVQLDAIRAALADTARQLGEAQGDSQVDRDNLAKLYRGFMAASRVVGHLQDIEQTLPR